MRVARPLPSWQLQVWPLQGLCTPTRPAASLQQLWDVQTVHALFSPATTSSTASGHRRTSEHSDLALARGTGSRSMCPLPLLLLDPTVAQAVWSTNPRVHARLGNNSLIRASEGSSKLRPTWPRQKHEVELKGNVNV